MRSVSKFRNHRLVNKDIEFCGTGCHHTLIFLYISMPHNCSRVPPSETQTRAVTVITFPGTFVQVLLFRARAQTGNRRSFVRLPSFFLHYCTLRQVHDVEAQSVNHLDRVSPSQLSTLVSGSSFRSSNPLQRSASTFLRQPLRSIPAGTHTCV